MYTVSKLLTQPKIKSLKKMWYISHAFLVWDPCVCQSFMHIWPNCLGEQRRLRRGVRKGRAERSGGRFGCHLDTHGKKGPQLKRCLHQLGLWVCERVGEGIFVPDVESSKSVWACHPGLYEGGEQANQQCSSMVSALNFYLDFPQWWAITCKIK